MGIIFSSTLVNIDDVGGIHPPVSRLGRAPGRLGHLCETSWEVARHNTNLEFGWLDRLVIEIKDRDLRFFKELFVDISKLLPKTEGPVNIHR